STRTGRSPAVWATIGGIPAPTARPRTCSCRPDTTPQATTSGPVTPTSQNVTSQVSSCTRAVTEPRSAAVRGDRDPSTDIAASTAPVNVASTTRPAPASSGQAPVRAPSTGTATANPNPSAAAATGGSRRTHSHPAVRYAARCQRRTGTGARRRSYPPLRRAQATAYRSQPPRTVLITASTTHRYGWRRPPAGARPGPALIRRSVRSGPRRG